MRLRDPARPMLSAIHLLERCLDIVERRRDHPGRGFVWTRLVDPLDLVVGDAPEIWRVSGTCLNRRFRPRQHLLLARPLLDRADAPRCRRESGDTVYFADSNSIELRDLGVRHPVVRQSADATELGARYIAVIAPGHCRSRYLLRFRSRFGFRRFDRRHRRDREDTWLPSRLRLS